MGFIWALIVGGVIGAPLEQLLKKDHRWALLLNIIAWVSWFNNWSSHFRHMGTSLVGMAIVPSGLSGQ